MSAVILAVLSLWLCAVVVESKEVSAGAIARHCRGADEPRWCPRQAAKGNCEGETVLTQLVAQSCPCSCTLVGALEENELEAALGQPALKHSPVDDNHQLVTDDQAFVRIQECCHVNRDIDWTDDCMPMCRYNITKREVYTPTGILCFPGLASWTYCSADHHDNSECCLANRIPSKCLPFCKGQMPACGFATLATRFGICLNHLATIQQCHRKGLTQETYWQDGGHRGQCPKTDRGR